MAWMSDEQYEYVKDCKEKSITARSARHTKTHTGKGGAVKFPSDYMTKKEREAMNGECKSYRMNDPITWEEFKSWPKEHQETYIKLLRKKFNVPAGDISEMMGMHRSMLSYHIKRNKLNVGKFTTGHHTWDKDGFLAWCSGAKGGMVKPSETPVEEESDAEINIPEEDADLLLKEEEARESMDNYAPIEEVLKEGPGPVICTNTYHHIPVIPKSGRMTFENNDADDALATMKSLLSNVKVNLTISWECVSE